MSRPGQAAARTRRSEPQQRDVAGVAGRRRAVELARASPPPPGRRPSTGGPAARRTGRTPIEPAPIVVCRSRLEPHSSRESLACTSPSRPGPDGGLQGVERRGHPARHGEVVPGRPGVAGVEADADLRVVLQRGQVGAEVLDGRGQRLPAAGGRLDQQPRRGVGEGVEHRQQPLVQLAQRGLVAVLADGGAGVHDHALAAELGAAGQVVGDRGDRLLDGRLGGGADVDQERRVDERRDAALGAARGEQRVLRRVAGGELPAARVADEDLHGPGARRRRCRRARPWPGRP